MSADDHEDLLDFYLRELNALEVEGKAFATRYPRVAAGLGVGASDLVDPQIEQLVHSVAYLTARLQRRLDRQTAGLAGDMLDTLYPLLGAPLPSMAIAQMRLDAAQARARDGALLPAGTSVDALDRDGPVCRFRTAGDTRLWPVGVTGIRVVSAAERPFFDDRSDVLASVVLRLSAEGGRFGERPPDPLRLFVGGLRPRAMRLLDVVLAHGRGLVVHRTDDGRHQTLLEGALRPFGLEDTEALLPLPTAADPACRLLLEYFAYPAKHLLVDVVGLGASALLEGAAEVELHLPIDRPMEALGPVDGVDVRTNAVPLVNLFGQISEPIRIDRTRSTYRLDPDRLRARTTEVYRVEEVFRGPLGEPPDRPIEPLYGFRATHLEAAPEAFWTARRIPTSLPDADGTDIEIAFLDPHLDPKLPAVDVAYARTTCTNRGFAAQLPVGYPLDVQRELPIASARLVTVPTAQMPPLTARGTAWQLTSQLTLNHLSLGGGQGLDAFKEILRLYAGPAGNTMLRQIEAVTRLEAEEAVRRIGPDAWRGFVVGTRVAVEVDREGFAGASPILFGHVLDRFLARYAALDSFTELHLHIRQEPTTVHRWKPRCGTVPLL